jgi:hypothetical protein
MHARPELSGFVANLLPHLDRSIVRHERRTSPIGTASEILAELVLHKLPAPSTEFRRHEARERNVSFEQLSKVGQNSV